MGEDLVITASDFVNLREIAACGLELDRIAGAAITGRLLYPGWPCRWPWSR
jgi:hypothetical protein